MPSAVIAAYDYNADLETLTIRYHSGKVYNYLGVPEKVFEQMRSTMAKGIWFNRHIKGKYPFEEVTADLKPQVFGRNQKAGECAIPSSGKEEEGVR